MTLYYIRRGANLTLYTPVTGDLLVEYETSGTAIVGTASEDFDWFVSGTQHGMTLDWRDGEEYLNGGLAQFSSIEFEVSDTLYYNYARSGGGRDTTYRLLPYVRSGVTPQPSWASNLYSWMMKIDAYQSGSKYYFRVFFESSTDPRDYALFPLFGEWILRMEYYETSVSIDKKYVYLTRIKFQTNESAFTNVHRSDVAGTIYSITETVPQDSCYSYLTSSWSYGKLGEGIICVRTDDASDGGPAVQQNDLWYVWSSGNTSQIVTSSTTSTVYYSALMGSPQYYLYDASTDTRTLVYLERKQVGSTYTFPQTAGTCKHYTFSNWRYRGVDYSGGDTFVTYPASYYVQSNWIGDTYTVQYRIEPSNAFCPPPTPENTSYKYPDTNVNPLETPSEDTWLTLPDNAITLDNYDYKGWSNDGGTTRYAGGTKYLPVANTVFTTVFDPKIYTVKFYDYGQSTPLYTQTVTYPNTVTIPNTVSVQGYKLMGWKKKNSYYDIIIESNATSFQPTSNVADLYQTVEVERVYQYTLSLYRRDSSTSRTLIYTTMSSFPETIQLPDSASTYTNGKIPAGYDLCGWTTEDYVYSKDIAKSGTYTFTTQYTVANNTVVLQAIPLYYMALTPKELVSISIEAESITLIKDDSGKITVNVVPNDWLGTVEWVAQAEEQSSGIYVDLQPNDRNITVSALEPTGTDTLTLTAQGHKKTWDVTSDYVTDSVRIRIFDYVPISFFTKNDLGMDIPYNNNTYEEGGDETNTFFTSQDVETSVWEWIEGPCTKLFPTNPSRTGYVFTGWVDADGNLIDFDHPPQNPINVYATWAGTYVDKDEDSLYLQLFNFDGNRMMKQYDMGIIQSNTETFNTGVSAQPTPTMTSVNTFITNLNCTESVSVKIIRKSPEIVRDANGRILNDDSDDPLVWTNRKWLLEMRGLVDRWQSATDGIKLLYIPRGMKVIKILDQYAGIGDNYDLLGYVKEFSDDTDANNSGLLFEQDGKRYVLIGYNGIISTYSDNYMATYRRVAEVSITFKLGGMKSKYQNWKDALVLLK